MRKVPWFGAVGAAGAGGRAVRTVTFATLLLVAGGAGELQAQVPGDGQPACAVVEGLRTGKRPVLDVQFDQTFGRSEIARSKRERSVLAGRLQLKLAGVPTPEIPSGPIPVVAAELLYLYAQSMKLLDGGKSGEIVIRRDFKRDLSGEFDPATGLLQASIPVAFTARAFLRDPHWVLPGGQDSGPEPRPVLTTLTLSGTVADGVLSARGTIALPRGLPVLDASTLTLVMMGEFSATIADVPRLSFNVRRKAVAVDGWPVVTAEVMSAAMDGLNQRWAQCCIDFGMFGVTWPLVSQCTGLICIPSDASFPGSDGNLACANLTTTDFPGSEELEYMFNYSASPFEGVIETVIVDHLTNASTPSAACTPSSPADGVAWRNGPVAVDLDGDLAQTLAHELGHVLLGPDHPADPNNLMSEHATGTELTLEQCQTARSNLFWLSGPDCSM